MTNYEAALLARLGDPVIPYTHWAYFADRSHAQACSEQLGSLDFLVSIDPTVLLEEPGDWLLRATREVDVDDILERHAEVEAIVVHHGGKYDGGESGPLEATPEQITAIVRELGD